jgi:MoxR-like ATPase
MNIPKEIQKKVATGRAAQKCGVKNINIIDVNERFGMEWDETNPLRFVGVPNAEFWGEEFNEFFSNANKDFFFDEDALRYALVAFELGRPVMMTGPTGSGKSDFFNQFFVRLNWPALRVQGSDDIDIDYLFGSKGLKAGETVFEDGCLTFARKHDVAVCLDEIDSLRKNVQLALNGYLENSGSLAMVGASFSDRNQSIVDTTGHQPIWSTSNTGGKSQARAGFHGTNAINKAVLDRFVHLEVDYLPQGIETKILKAKCLGIDDRLIGPMIETANLIRKAYVNGQVDTTLSTRSLIDWADFSKSLGLSDAFQICNYAQTEPSDRQLFKSAFETGIGARLELPNHLEPEGLGDVAA